MSTEAGNLARWDQSGGPSRWVWGRKGHWNHADWLTLLVGLRRDGYWPMAEADIGRRLEVLKAQYANLQRWQASGAPQKWVEARRRNWNHGDWLALLTELRKSAYWPLQEEWVELVLDELKRTPLPKPSPPAPTTKAPAKPVSKPTAPKPPAPKPTTPKPVVRANPKSVNLPYDVICRHCYAVYTCTTLIGTRLNCGHCGCDFIAIRYAGHKNPGLVGILTGFAFVTDAFIGEKCLHCGVRGADTWNSRKDIDRLDRRVRKERFELLLYKPFDC